MRAFAGVPVVVILGAGASLASGNYTDEAAPPLTVSLFDHTRAQGFIHEYPLAQMAGRFIERELSENRSLSFEQVLLGLRTSPNAQRRLMALGVPLFLQDLLLRTSESLYYQASRYDALIDLLSDLPKVHYVTLNYDVLLDARLHSFRRLDDFSDYIDPQNQWSLIKLHGSVNWGYEIYGGFDPLHPPPDLRLSRSNMACLRPVEFDLSRLRGATADGTAMRYPAIALPEGPKDELVLPGDHERYLRQSLSAARQVDVMVIGYSALDTEVLALIRDSARQIRRLTIVNRDPRAALDVWDLVAQENLEVVWPDVFDGSFVSWIDNGGLKAWVQEYGGRYLTVTEPEMLRRELQVREFRQGAGKEADLPPLPDRW